MTATLTFTLPDEQTEFENAAHANDVRSAIDELREDIRNKQKHGHSFPTTEDAIQYFYLRLCEI